MKMSKIIMTTLIRLVVMVALVIVVGQVVANRGVSDARIAPYQTTVGEAVNDIYLKMDRLADVMLDLQSRVKALEIKLKLKEEK